MIFRWIGLVAVAAGLLAACPETAQAGGRPDRYQEVPGIRQPTMSKLQLPRDAASLERIEWHRAKLPLPYRERFNFAWAVADIPGLDKVEYFAHSSIQDLEDFSAETAAELAGISLRPDPGHYHTLCVNQRDVVDGDDCWQRSVDTEFKIIEDIVSRLPDTQVKGRVKLYTDLAPCASCWNVMKQFMAEYPNIRVQVLYRQR